MTSTSAVAFEKCTTETSARSDAARCSLLFICVELFAECLLADMHVVDCLLEVVRLFLVPEAQQLAPVRQQNF